MILESKYPNTVQEYSSMDELKQRHPDGVINGVEISQPHFFQFDGCAGSHHCIIEFSGPKYGYDNIIIGTKGAMKTVYFLSNGEVQRKVRQKRMHLFESDKFIALGHHLYHIPTGKRTRIDERSFELVERVPNVIDFKGKDKQIEWTGGGFKKYDNISAEEAEDSSIEIDEEELRSKDMRDVVDSSEASYDRMLNNIVDDIYWVNDTREAEKYVNGEFEIPERQKEKRRYQEIKTMYATGQITIDQFEKRLEKFLSDNEEYIWVTGEYSETQISDFSDEEETKEKEKNSAFDW